MAGALPWRHYSWAARYARHLCAAALFWVSFTSLSLLASLQLYVANVGDSEAVMSVDGVAVPVSRPHNMNQNPDEEARVREAGGRVHRKRIGHPVFNPQYFNIGVTRAIGDLMYKDATM